jgi:hypothetical protein
MVMRRTAMSVDGKWQLDIDIPGQKQDFWVELTENGGELEGHLVNHSTDKSSPIFAGSAEGDQIRFKAKLQQIKMTIAFTLTRHDDVLIGKVKAGVFGSFAVSGQRH